ncbi:caspase family protein [Mucilaginibacter sp. cycad4]|uniref:caspase family protein n=1 Tax=Mucilaginibacter sp. cycad4 TaxID=3342096 RepID=UPI002AABDE98|nr:caspase family protein [Mucilaginibacter gossypii]WPV00807.1 caspase family protein [Mucilaginibacter gossypii]
MKLALIVGINYYEHGSGLTGCVNDAYSVESMLKRNDGGSINFDCNLLTASGKSDSISRAKLKDSISQLFGTPGVDTALFYFAGHGHIESAGGYILASDARRGDEGVRLGEIMKFANDSPAINKIIILDSCHSGLAGADPGNDKLSVLADGMTILTASRADQTAAEKDGSGVFTTLMVDALSGSAADLVGHITPGSIYAHIDKSLGGWGQRPIFKTNIQQFVSLREVTPPISRDDLRSLADYFPRPGFKFQLDPTFEPEKRGRKRGTSAPVEENTKIFARLQKFNRLNLLVPIDAPHMWHAAMESKTCQLTALGEHYRQLIERGRL